MKILYIIGNGLDIAFHLKTSYQDFFKYYLALKTDDKDLLAMKKDINSHRYETWADLEIGLGLYSQNCSDKDVFLKCLVDIKENLRVYLNKESEKIGEYIISTTSHFISPGYFLEPEPRARYFEFCNRKSRGAEIDVVTLNYTNTLETVLNFRGRANTLSDLAILNSINHIHGTLDNMMVMGVNDSSQIANASFNTELDVIEDFIKPEFNDACMNNKNSDCETLIYNADLIVLYGTSLGPSDDKWWKLIGKRLGTDHYPMLVYLPYDEKKNQAAEPNHLRRWTMDYVREIKDKFGIAMEDKLLSYRICVALNKELFPLKRVVNKNSVTK